MSNFSFSHSVFKRPVSQGHQKVSSGNGLTESKEFRHSLHWLVKIEPNHFTYHVILAETLTWSCTNSLMAGTLSPSGTPFMWASLLYEWDLLHKGTTQKINSTYSLKSGQNTKVGVRMHLPYGSIALVEVLHCINSISVIKQRQFTNPCFLDYFF